MKQSSQQKNPYATNRGGKIIAPNAPSANDPKATVRRGEDLRKR